MDCPYCEKPIEPEKSFEPRISELMTPEEISEYEEFLDTFGAGEVLIEGLFEGLGESPSALQVTFDTSHLPGMFILSGRRCGDQVNTKIWAGRLDDVLIAVGVLRVTRASNLPIGDPGALAQLVDPEGIIEEPLWDRNFSDALTWLHDAAAPATERWVRKRHKDIRRLEKFQELYMKRLEAAYEEHLQGEL